MSVNPYAPLKILIMGIFFGYLIGRYRFKKRKSYQFTNLRFGDLEQKKELKL
jgi:hypothetical protein